MSELVKDQFLIFKLRIDVVNFWITMSEVLKDLTKFPSFQSKIDDINFLDKNA